MCHLLSQQINCCILYFTYLVGTLVAAVVGWFAIRLVNLLADKGKFGAFAWYCWAAGLISLVAGFLVK